MIKWVFQHIIGLTLAFPVFILLTSLLLDTPPRSAIVLVFIPPLGAGIGIILGAAQQFALERWLTIPDRWWRATAIGWTLGITISLAFLPAQAESAILGSVIVGLLTGIMQWSMLRRQVHRASLWLVANVAGWIAGLVLGLAMYGYHRDHVIAPAATGELGEFVAVQLPLYVLVVIIPAVSVVIGTITGFALVWLFRHSVQLANYATTKSISSS